MHLALVTDAWAPQVNGVVRTLQRTKAELERLGHQVDVISPDQFRTFRCPTYPEIRLALLPWRKLSRQLDALKPDAIHIATEGPLGRAARAWCLKRRLPFTTAYHTRVSGICRGALRRSAGLDLRHHAALPCAGRRGSWSRPSRSRTS